MKIFFSTLLALSGSWASATLQTQSILSDSLTRLSNPGQADEICAPVRHFADGLYSAKDLKDEDELCSLNKSTTAAVCPKLNSTNPGLDFYAVPDGQTAQAFAAANCKPDSKKLAKYKLSTSCSYTPSLLSYYHLSRVLGADLKVPVAVVRTFDLVHHLELAKKGYRLSQGLIQETWASLLRELQRGKDSKRRDRLFTSDFQQSYGALQLNPRGESRYAEFFNGGANNLQRALNFKNKNPYAKLLASSTGIDQSVSRTFSQDSVQSLVQLQDAANMILMDYLLSQEDRFGNIHALEAWAYVDAGVVKTKKNLTPEEVQTLGAVKIKKMILKDNDCGVARENIAQKAELLSLVRHIEPEVYRRIRLLDRSVDDETVQSFFRQGLLFTDEDFKTFRTNLKRLSAHLYESCQSGRLRQDLDSKVYFTSAPLDRSCEI
ncbi:MAG: hypothetical protein AB7F86_04270 [Bdellovibrionales bacterium]